MSKLKVIVLKCECEGENNFTYSLLQNPDDVYASKKCGFCGEALSRKNLTSVDRGNECPSSYDGFHEGKVIARDQGNGLNTISECEHCGQRY